MAGSADHNLAMLSRIFSFGVWALVAAAAVYWGTRVFVRAPPAPSSLTVVAAQPPAQADWTRLFGPDAAPVLAQAAPEPAADARFQLIGVVAPRGKGSGGVALIGVDGKPPRAYRLGASIDGALVLQGVQSREVTLGQAGGATQVRLVLPPLPVAATGSLPPPMSNLAAAPAFGAGIAPRTGMPGAVTAPAGRPGLPAPFMLPPQPIMRGAPAEAPTSITPVQEEPPAAANAPTTPGKSQRRRVTTM